MPVWRLQSFFLCTYLASELMSLLEIACTNASAFQHNLCGRESSVNRPQSKRTAEKQSANGRKACQTAVREKARRTVTNKQTRIHGRAEPLRKILHVWSVPARPGKHTCCTCDKHGRDEGTHTLARATGPEAAHVLSRAQARPTARRHRG